MIKYTTQVSVHWIYGTRFAYELKDNSIAKLRKKMQEILTKYIDTELAYITFGEIFRIQTTKVAAPSYKSFRGYNAKFLNSTHKLIK